MNERMVKLEEQIEFLNNKVREQELLINKLEEKNNESLNKEIEYEKDSEIEDSSEEEEEEEKIIIPPPKNKGRNTKK
jgi:hypothetical protein